MPFIQVTAGGPDIPDGVYPVILTDIKGPRTVTAQRGPKAGQDIDLLDWIFAIDAPNNPYDAYSIDVSTSTASGPKSKMYGFLTALFGGVAPTVGAAFEKEHLVGRRALATVQKDAEGWVRIVNLSAIPVTLQQAAFQRVTTVATPPVAAPAPTPAPQPVAATGTELPF